MLGLSLLDSCGIMAVRESWVIRCRALPAEPFERSGIDEPFATSMTQLPMDRPQTFSVLPCRQKTPGVQGTSAAEKLKSQRTTSLRSAGDATLSDLELQHELSPEQMREAL